MSENKDILVAQKAIDREIEALEIMKKELDENFSKVLDLIIKIKGRVIVTGMGKSGHIGRKIAATLASTGTPSFFVHPGEASHGDLGMLTNDDVVLAISNGGESRELSDILMYCKRYNIPLIAMTKISLCFNKSDLPESRNPWACSSRFCEVSIGRNR